MRARLHPSVVGVIVTLLVFAATTFVYSLGGFQCGREIGFEGALLGSLVWGWITLGFVYIAPGVLAGIFATQTPWMRKPRPWVLVTLVLFAALGICFALQGPTPTPVPTNCRIDL